ncbi:MAG: chorismate-binding protein [Syntrophaceae bacterium]|nr:chorismate-binding protein [Syntrophaceae bacterium]
MSAGDNFVLLETEKKDKDNYRNILFVNPIDIIVATHKDDLQKCLYKVEKALANNYFVAGFISYEAGYLLEETLHSYFPKSKVPLLWLGVYDAPHVKNEPFLSNVKSPYYISAPSLSVKYNQYKSNIEKIKYLISWGKTYQINYTLKYYFNFYGDIISFYSALKKNQKVQYSALIGHKNKFILSLSPELFFRIDDNKITVKPMKGTATADTPSDWLAHDEKNLSENVMIVDLLRNDLGRICIPGTIKVDELYSVETYETISQMTSTVSGTLRPDISASEVIKNIFPCGSVTGAPKIQSMKIIRSLENTPRGVYTGAIGYFSPRGEAVFNVAIRTIELAKTGNKKYSGHMGVGSGIVYDSQARKEYYECWMKNKFLKKSMPKLGLIETMLCADGKIRHINMHLFRLKTSAQYFLIPCDTMKIKAELKRYAIKLKGKIRLRLVLSSGGRIKIEHRQLPSAPKAVRHIAFSEYATRSDDPFLFHKTTFRQLYEREYARYSSRGFYDVIFCNEKKQITEGAISNIFLRIKGKHYTPPVSCGLLNGIQRQIFKKKTKAVEKVLYLRDLQKADEVILTNSIRGAKQVYLRDNY